MPLSHAAKPAHYVNIDEFDFELPEARIARTPSAERDASRLLVYQRSTDTAFHRRFCDLPAYLRQGDVLVRNNVRVVPSRLVLHRATGGKVEALVLSSGGSRMAAMLESGGRLQPGERLRLANIGDVCVVVEGRDAFGWNLRVDGATAHEILDRAGRVPIPPYIRAARRRAGEPDQDELDPDRYQTVYAKDGAAVAAPTAGLHFTENLLQQIKAMGVEIVNIQLDVGPGTFAPVRADRIEDHRMHSEEYSIPPESARTIQRAREEKRRVVAVGTTVVRTLEHALGSDGAVRAGRGASDLFIYPGFQFRVIDALITNFHTPRSTLLMLVSAFAGRENILKLYKMAVVENYRFYSYGDATLLL